MPVRMLLASMALLLVNLVYRPDVILAADSGAHNCLSVTRFLLREEYSLVLHGLEIISFFHEEHQSRIHKHLVRQLYDRAYRIITVSSSTRDVLLDKLPSLEPKTQVVLHGISMPETENPDALAQTVRRSLGISDDAYVILTVARLAPGKGQDHVIRALPQILARHPETAYVIVGSGTCRQELGDLARQLNIQQAVFFVGDVPRERVWAYYHACDIFVMLSRWESLGIVFLEAAACGKPVVTGRQGGVAEAVDDGVTGILVDSDDLKEVSKAILSLIEDQEMSQLMGRNAREHYVRKYSSKSMALKTLSAVLGED